jgi:hypothetical protein
MVGIRQSTHDAQQTNGHPFHWSACATCAVLCKRAHLHPAGTMSATSSLQAQLRAHVFAENFSAVERYASLLFSYVLHARSLSN